MIFSNCVHRLYTGGKYNVSYRRAKGAQYMNETWENNNIEANAVQTEAPEVIKEEKTERETVQAEETVAVAETEGITATEPQHEELQAQPEIPSQNLQYQNVNQPYYGQAPQEGYGNPAYQQNPQQGYPYGAPVYPYNNPAYRNPYYNPAYQQMNPIYQQMPPVYQKQPKQKKKPGKFAKFLGVAAAALLFGVIAGGSFLGVNCLYNYLNPQEDVREQIIIGTDGNRADVLEGNDKIQSSTVIESQYIQGTSVSDIAEEAMPSTVAINCTFTTDSWFGRYETPGSGSGIIVGKNEKELLIVTNNHVIDGANTIKVILIDETETEAVVKGTAASTDLAVIAVPLESLTEETLGAIKVAKLGNSDDIKVGEMVVAIGNALGYGQSVTVGYISAKDREVTVDNTKMTLLQTDAAINPGNSGGALLNLEGEVIGINSVKYADEDVEGMCFAIPVSRVEDIIQNLMNSLSDEEKGYLGVGVNDVTEAIAEYYNWPVGVYVVNFSEDSAAEEAGIKIGDIITGVNGIVVETANELIERVTTNPYGTTVTITLQRNIDGEYQELEFEVVLRQSAEFKNMEN